MSTPKGPSSRPGDRDHRLHDVDLVAAYASDDPGIDRDSASALVAACPECRSEFHLQRQVATWMSAAPTVALGDDERSILHERVNGAIARPNVVSLADRRSRRQPGQILFRIGAAAAALAVIAGLGGVFNQVGGGNGGDAAFQTIASEADNGSEEALVAAAPTTTTAASFAATSAQRALLTGGDAEAVKKEIEELIGQTAVPEAAGVPTESQADATLAAPPCSEKAEDREVLQIAESSLDGEPIVIFIVTNDADPDAAADADAEALVFNTADCSVVDLT